MRTLARLVVAGALPALMGATAPPAKVLTCKDQRGQTVIADPSDPRCFRPPPNEDQKALEEEQRRKEMEIYLACKAAQRSDQGLLSRYPDRATHDGARQKALDGLGTAMRSSQARIEQLLVERKRLLEEAEFYPDGKLPPKLRRDLDSNGALLEARRQAIANQEAEAANINKFYDDELAKLASLWKPKPGEGRGCVQPRIVKEAR